jgi:plastocyanin
MKTLATTVLAFTLAALSCFVRAQDEAPVSSSGSTVSGEIRFVEQKSGKAMKDSSDAAVWFVPLVGGKTAGLDTAKQTYRMVQRNKQFHPHLLVVPLGSTVIFPNQDPWFHNVFSLYRGKRFDLGLYEAGSQKAVRFDRLGASYIFCNIHPEMMAVVLTVETSFYAVSDQAGHWSIENVPPGRYRLHVWYENATPAARQALEREIEIGRGSAPVAVLTVPVTPHDWLHHPNLYGHDYAPKALTPVY